MSTHSSKKRAGPAVVLSLTGYRNGKAVYRVMTGHVGGEPMVPGNLVVSGLVPVAGAPEYELPHTALPAERTAIENEWALKLGLEPLL